MALKRQLDTDEQKARVVQAVKGLGIFPMEKIYKDYYQLSDDEINKMKDGLEKDQQDPVFGAMAQQGGAPGALPPPPPPGGEEPPPTPEPQPESIDIESMKSLAIEADCDDEMLKLLEDMSKASHFKK